MIESGCVVSKVLTNTYFRVGVSNAKETLHVALELWSWHVFISPISLSPLFPGSAQGAAIMRLTHIEQHGYTSRT